jgi:hypothetical protein
MEIINGIFSEAFWYIAPILVTLTTTIAGLINQGIIAKYVPEKHQAWVKQLIAWVLGAGLSCAAWGLKVIAFGNPVWLGVVCLCVVVGLASNGVYDIPFMRGWIEKWFKLKSQLTNDTVATHLYGAMPKQIKEDFVEAVAENKPIEEKPLKIKKVPMVKVSKKKPEPEVTD